MKAYEISYTDGRLAVYATFPEAVEALEAEYPELYAVDSSGWESDGYAFPTGSDRVLCWADENSSQDDDGRHAVAAIREREGQSTYEITVIESDEARSWQRLLVSEKWGGTEPCWRDGERLSKNVVLVTTDHPERLERALERDSTVLSYREVQS